MPCLTYDDNIGWRSSASREESQIESLKADVARLEASLCTALTFIEKSGRIDNYIAATDWQEAGIKPEQVNSWWRDHKEKDRIRREKEAKAKAAEEKKNRDREEKVAKLQLKTWSELTKAEIKFLFAHAKK